MLAQGKWMKNLLIQTDAATKPIKLYMTSIINSRFALCLFSELRHWYLYFLTSKAVVRNWKSSLRAIWKADKVHQKCALLITAETQRRSLWMKDNCKSGSEIVSEQQCVHGLMMAPSLSLSPLFPPVEPLPVTSVSIYDYKPSPETRVLFEIHYPEKYNVFSRVNISYWEGRDFRTMLYKGKRQEEAGETVVINFLQTFSGWSCLL